MKKSLYILIFVLLSQIVLGIKPKFSITAKGNVTDLIYENNKLYVSTDNALICIYSTLSQKLLNTVKLPDIKDFTGDNVAPKVYDIDKLKNENAILSVSQGIHGFSNVFIYKNGKLSKILSDTKNKLMIKKVKFVSQNKILLGLLSNEIILYDLLTKEQIYRKQISAYTFSDIVLNEDKTKLVTADESGIIHLIDVKTGKAISEFSGNNVDNVYQIDYKKNIVVCGGQDRRFSVYNISNHKSYYLQSDFLIYSVGLSPSGKVAGYSCNEQNDIQIVNTLSKIKLQKLQAHESTITKILFLSDNKLFTSAEETKIYYWEF